MALLILRDKTYCMSNTDKCAQYCQFMEWFQGTYPQLYVSYHLFISAPSGSNRVNVSFLYVQPEDKKALITAIDEFYQTFTV